VDFDEIVQQTKGMFPFSEIDQLQWSFVPQDVRELHGKGCESTDSTGGPGTHSNLPVIALTVED
jgi:hypothetical protein